MKNKQLHLKIMTVTNLNLYELNVKNLTLVLTYSYIFFGMTSDRLIKLQNFIAKITYSCTLSNNNHITDSTYHIQQSAGIFNAGTVLNIKIILPVHIYIDHENV